MIKSMTGFGKESLSRNLREYQMEIKSVNHRYLDISVKLPKTLSYLEEEIKKVISSQVKRGKIDVFLNFDNRSQEGREIRINQEVAHAYIKGLKQLAKKEEILANIEVTEIAKFPDVLSVQMQQEDEKIKQEVLEVTQSAVLKLVEMRSREGEKMAQDLRKRAELVEKKINEISKISTGLIEEYVVKLEGRIKEILKTQELDQARLAQEVVIYADKCSIEEEVTRLESHIAQFQNFLSSRRCCWQKIRFFDARDES